MNLLKTNTNTPAVGDILLSMSGYDACIAYWAVVVSVTPKQVKIREVRAENDFQQGGMNWTSRPQLRDNTRKVLSRSWKDAGYSYSIKRNSYSSYTKHSGDSVECYNHH